MNGWTRLPGDRWPGHRRFVSTAAVLAIGAAVGVWLSRSASDPRHWHDFPTGAGIDHASLLSDAPWRLWHLQLADGAAARLEPLAAGAATDEVAGGRAASAFRMAIERGGAGTSEASTGESSVSGAGKPEASTLGSGTAEAGTAHADAAQSHAAQSIRLVRRLKPLVAGERLALRLTARLVGPGVTAPCPIVVRLVSLADGGKSLGWEAPLELDREWVTAEWNLAPDQPSDHAALEILLGLAIGSPAPGGAGSAGASGSQPVEAALASSGVPSVEGASPAAAPVTLELADIELRRLPATAAP